MPLKMKIPNLSEEIKRLNVVAKKSDAIFKQVAVRAGQAMQNEIKSELAKAPYPTGGIAAGMMPLEADKIGDSVSIEVGWKLGSYPKNSTVPTSDGWKALFINYGTPHNKAYPFMDKASEESTKLARKEARKAVTELIKELNK